MRRSYDLHRTGELIEFIWEALVAWDMFAIQALGRTLQGPYFSEQQAREAIARAGIAEAKIKALIPPGVESEFLDNDRLHRDHPGHEDV